MRRIPFKTSLPALLACSFLVAHAITVAAQTETPQPTQTQQRRLPKPTQTAPRVVAIEKYTDELDDYARLNPQARRFFANTAEDQTGNWQEVPSEKELENKARAIVWMKKDKPLIALLSGKSVGQSRRVTYYFRDNGTLAKVHSELQISAGNMQSVRDRSYDPKTFAILVRDFSYCTDMVTGQQKPCGDAEALEKSIPVYAKSTELPVYALLKKP
jgi:hypothetical protein